MRVGMAVIMGAEMYESRRKRSNTGRELKFSERQMK